MQKKMDGKKKKKELRRESVGEAMGVDETTPVADNLAEARALDAAVEAARRLNNLTSGGKAKKSKRVSSKRRSSIALMEQTTSLFAASSEDEYGEMKEKEGEGGSDSDAELPGLISQSEESCSQDESEDSSE